MHTLYRTILYMPDGLKTRDERRQARWLPLARLTLTKRRQVSRKR